MARRISATRLALWISIAIVALGIYMLWRHTRSMVQRDAHKEGTMLILPARPGHHPS